ncbi:MAG: hypothetical protein D6813_07215 [Calditrichaeota bacterium]|nr:MAG: hypothetical protein D6813_07215 [Calditrichota bacterium]
MAGHANLLLGGDSGAGWQGKWQLVSYIGISAYFELILKSLVQNPYLLSFVKPYILKIKKIA